QSLSSWIIFFATGSSPEAQRPCCAKTKVEGSSIPISRKVMLLLPISFFTFQPRALLGNQNRVGMAFLTTRDEQGRRYISIALKTLSWTVRWHNVRVRMSPTRPHSLQLATRLSLLLVACGCNWLPRNVELNDPRIQPLLTAAAAFPRAEYGFTPLPAEA